MSNVPQNQQATVRCTASGAKMIGESLTPREICARFVARLSLEGHRFVDDDSLPPAANEIAIALSFQPPGRAIADVVRITGGATTALPTRERAVMDRALTIEDVDMLADDVAADLAVQQQD